MSTAVEAGGWVRSSELDSWPVRTDEAITAWMSHWIFKHIASHRGVCESSRLAQDAEMKDSQHGPRSASTLTDVVARLMAFS